MGQLLVDEIILVQFKGSIVVSPCPIGESPGEQLIYSQPLMLLWA